MIDTLLQLFSANNINIAGSLVCSWSFLLYLQDLETFILRPLLFYKIHTPTEYESCDHVSANIKIKSIKVISISFFRYNSIKEKKINK